MVETCLSNACFQTLQRHALVAKATLAQASEACIQVRLGGLPGAVIPWSSVAAPCTNTNIEPVSEALNEAVVDQQDN